MVNSIQAPAPHVVAAQFQGEVTRNDVDQVIQMVENNLAKNRRVSLYLDLSQLESITPTAFLNDLGYSLKNLGRLYRFQQIAVVTDSPKLETVIKWEDKLFRSVEIKSFPSTQAEHALSWIERKPDLPEPGFQVEPGDTILVLHFGEEVTGHDITQVADLIHEHYEQHGPVRMLVTIPGVPKFGPGYIYEKLRQFNLVSLIERYAVVGPANLKSQVSAINPVIKTHLKYFEPGQQEAAETWLRDTTPSAQVLPNVRLDRFAFRISGKVTDQEVEAFYTALLPRLKEENGLDVILEIPYDDGVTLRAIFKAIKLGLSNFSKVTGGVRRLAVITDSRFLSKASEIENILIPSVEERPFTFNQRDIAVAWLDEGRPALTSQLDTNATKLLEAPFLLEPCE
jgi:hypothetical protein